MSKEKSFKIYDKDIYYYDSGKGDVVILLHGYLETKEIWSDLSNRLSNNFRVISIDIPGHGKSEVLDSTHSMELLAKAINSLLDYLNIKQCSLIGHSMGGYITLAFAELFPDKLKSFILLHSSVYADNDIKKENRLNDIKLIEQGELKKITDSNIPKMFANDNLSAFSNNIYIMQKYAQKFDTDGVVALIKGMMNRTDKQNFIRTFNKPMLFIFGKKDNFISIDVAKEMLKLNSNIEYKILNNSGHMGFIEEAEEVVDIIKRFI